MIKKRPIAIDLFAGAGGLSLGFEQAGFDVVAAVEIDPVHACVHEFNFPHCAVIARSVSDLSGDQIRQLAGIGDACIDVVVGGAPCQGFSMIGQRALDDPRNMLVKEFIRIVKELSPKYFVFENVKGLTLGKHKKFLPEMVLEIADIGYDVLEPWRVLNAKHFGVPQSRERLFLIGSKKGNALPQYPTPLDELITCKDALSDLPDADQFSELVKSDTVQTGYLAPPNGYNALMRCVSEDSWKMGYKRNWNQNLITSSIRTNHSQKSKTRFDATIPGTVEPISRYFRLPPNGVSNTLRAGTDSSRGAFTSPRPIHYKFPRVVTVREMARLHGFPDWFRLHKTKWHGARQIGNSVPPPLAYAIANELAKVLPYNIVPPEEVIDLGSEILLSMTVTEASAYWGIDNPIAQRTRKPKQSTPQLQLVL